MNPADLPRRGLLLPVSTTLPPDAVRDLTKAAATENTTTDPHRRTKEIEHAIARTKAK